ncbi:MAG: hypothetical protein GX799_02525 [Crenarchaeota archaeon]|nr:hypothetical protein [Thermoproteota archaeon]
MYPKLTDVFGKAEMENLNGLMTGKTVEDILEHTENKHLKSRYEEIKTTTKDALSENDIFITKHLIETINHLNGQIRDWKIELRYLPTRMK